MPFISVIINAYNRRDYLLSAVSSALHQTLSGEKYEIIVVKNFEDTEIDEFLDENQVKRVLEKSPFWNISISAALEISRGEVVCFLDDDDYFAPEKLEKIDRTFSEDDIVFCKNGITPVDENGTVLNGYRDITMDKSYFYIDQFGTFIGRKSYLSLFNISSMSMLKKPLLEHLKKVNGSKDEKIGFRFAIDNFVCFSSVESGKCMVMPDKLTFYRHHSGQVTVNKGVAEDFYQKKKTSESIHGQSYSYMKRAFSTEIVLQKLEDMIVQSEIQVSILSLKESGFSPKLIPKALRNLMATREKYLLILLSIYLLSMLSTSLSLFVYKNMVTMISRKLN